MIGGFMIVVSMLLLLWNIFLLLCSGLIVGDDLWEVNMFEWVIILLLLVYNFDCLFEICLEWLLFDVCYGWMVEY